MDKEIMDFCRLQTLLIITLLSTSVWLAVKNYFEYGFDTATLPNLAAVVGFSWYLYSSRRVIYKSFPGIFKSKL